MASKKMYDSLSTTVVSILLCCYHIYPTTKLDDALIPKSKAAHIIIHHHLLAHFSRMIYCLVLLVMMYGWTYAKNAAMPA